MIEKLKLLKLLKNLFKNDDINGAFDDELKKFLEKINPLEIPDNLTSFYYTNIEIKENIESNIKSRKVMSTPERCLVQYSGFQREGVGFLLERKGLPLARRRQEASFEADASSRTQFKKSL